MARVGKDFGDLVSPPSFIITDIRRTTAKMFIYTQASMKIIYFWKKLPNLKS